MEGCASLHVLDLPPLYTRPSAAKLLDVLERLALRLGSFDGNCAGDGHGLSPVVGNGDGIPRYLTGIVGSRLAWIEADEAKERIWEAASMRLSERSGRNAMPTSSRTFQIPTTNNPLSSTISINLQEPSLTSDNLGHKTWAASYLLAKRLAHFIPVLPTLPPFKPPCTNTGQDGKTTSVSEPRILELGAGTGLVGIAAASIFAVHVDLTDLAEICPNLSRNIISNAPIISSNGGSATSFPLDWSTVPPSESVPLNEKYDIILTSDPLYSPSHPKMLVDAIGTYLKEEGYARVIVELPLREA
ncbi:MAG: hypothetical protein Q9187_008783, partial [Circinaria calcarea]